MGVIPVGLLALLVISLVHAAVGRRRRFELRMQVLELLELSVRRGLSFVPVLRKAASGGSRRSRRVFTKLARELEQGEDLCEALETVAPTCFPPRVRATIRAAEGSAELQPLLASLVEQTDEGMVFQHRLAMTLLYPLCLALGLLMAQEAVIAVYRALAMSMAVTDPTASWFSIAMMFAGWLPRRIEPWLVVATLILGSLWLLHESLRTGSVPRRLLAEVTARIPPLSRSGRFLVASRFLSALSHCIAAGQPLPAAMRRAAGGAGSRRLQDRVAAGASLLQEGHAAADAWRLLGLPGFASLSLAAATSGERHQFAGALRRMAVVCSERSLAARERMVEVLQPIVILLLGTLLAIDFGVLMSINGIVREATGLW